MAILNTLYAGQGLSSSGGTITGDLTISGDLSVEGGGSFTYDEMLTGNFGITVSDSATSGQIVITQGGEGDSSIYFVVTGDNAFSIGVDNTSDTFKISESSDLGTNTRLELDENSRISLSNNDASGAVGTTLFGYLAGANIVDGAINNTYIGYGVGDATHTNAADNNTGVGYNALTALTTAQKTTVVGSGAGVSLTTGSYNAFFGADAGYTMATGTFNTAIGYSALWSAELTESYNVAIGSGALGSLKMGTDTTDTTRCDYNIAIGNNAALSGDFVTADTDFKGNIAIGAFALDDTSTNTQTGTIAIGHQALTALTSGAGNTAVGYSAMNDLVDGSNNTAIGYNAFGGTFADTTADASSDNVFVGKDAGSGDWETAVSNYNVGVGNNVMDGDMDGALENTAVGHNALSGLISGDKNCAFGTQALEGLTTGNFNTVMGWQAMDGATGLADDNVAIGNGAMGGAIGAEVVDDCVAIGSGALAGALSSSNGEDEASGTVAIGKSALAALTSGEKNTAIGYEALLTQEDGDKNTAVGYKALKMAEGSSPGYGYNTAVGSEALTALTTGTGCVALGADALLTSTDGDGNVAIGFNALKMAAVSEDFNIAIGYGAMASVDEGTAGGDADHNIAIGLGALTGGDFAGNDRQLQGNIAIGTSALDSTGAYEQIGTIAIGHQSLTALTSGAGNTAIGYNAMLVHTTGARNMAIGYGAMNDTDGTNISSGSAATVLGSLDNIFIGYDSGGGDWCNATAAAASNYNVAIGNYTMDYTMSGALRNIALGHSAMSSLGSGDDNIVIGAGAAGILVRGNQNVFIGTGTDLASGQDDDSNVILIGYDIDLQTTHPSTSSSNKAFIGNASVTDVYMAQDSGATVHCAGIKFDASGEVLGDYEEGSWTIAVTCATSGTYTLNSSYDRGEYTKIGRIVHAQGYGSISSNSSPTGDTRISLPYAAADLDEYAGHTGGSITVHNMDFTGNFYTMELAEGAQYFRIVEITDGSGADYVEGAELAGDFFFNVTYIAA